MFPCCVVHISGNFLYDYISCLLEVLNRNRKAISLLCHASILFGCAGKGFVCAGILLHHASIVLKNSCNLWNSTLVVVED